MSSSLTNDDVLAVAKIIDASVRFHADISKSFLPVLIGPWLSASILITLLTASNNSTLSVILSTILVIVSGFTLGNLYGLFEKQAIRMKDLDNEIKSYTTPNVEKMWKSLKSSLKRYGWNVVMAVLLLAQACWLIYQKYDSQ